MVYMANFELQIWYFIFIVQLTIVDVMSDTV